MIGSLTVLPALLAWLGDRVEKGTDPLHPQPAPAGRRVALLGGLVDASCGTRSSRSRSPGGLLAAGGPRARHQHGRPGPSDFPEDLAIVQTYNRVQQAFPSGPTRGGRGRGRRRATRRGRVGRSSGSWTRPTRSDALLPGAAATYSGNGEVAKILIPTPGDGSDDAPARQRWLRSGESSSRRRSGRSPVPRWTSPAARPSRMTSTQLIAQRMPLVFAFVLGLAFLLLLVTFRSIVIPIKAILLNLLSVGAAYGVLVLDLPERVVRALLGFSRTAASPPWLPLFLFVILFGLSMDYHVFILSRIREACYQPAGSDTDEAVGRASRPPPGRSPAPPWSWSPSSAIFAALTIIDMKQIGCRPGRRGADRRDGGARRAAAGDDEAARRLELVPAGLDRPTPAGRPGGRSRERPGSPTTDSPRPEVRRSPPR